MKTLYVIPSMGEEQPFYLVDIKSGEALASHYCSGAHFAKGDLLDCRPERKIEFKEKYGEEVECKFFNEQHEVTEEEFGELNKKFAEEQDHE